MAINLSIDINSKIPESILNNDKYKMELDLLGNKRNNKNVLDHLHAYIEHHDIPSSYFSFRFFMVLTILLIIMAIFMNNNIALYACLGISGFLLIVSAYSAKKYNDVLYDKLKKSIAYSNYKS